MSRKKRLVKKVFKVFCEGDTEYNYFEYIRKNKKVSLDLRYKKERLVGFNLDSESLAKNLNDERFNKIEILITGIDDKSAANRGV